MKSPGLFSSKAALRNVKPPTTSRVKGGASGTLCKRKSGDTGRGCHRRRYDKPREEVGLTDLYRLPMADVGRARGSLAAIAGPEWVWGVGLLRHQGGG